LPLGDYTAGKTKKSYYVSKDTFVKRGDAIQACAAFDMSLAAPTNQEEYNNLKMLAEQHEMYEWIDGYRSQSNKEEWQVAGLAVPYNITWSESEPNNAKGSEDCLALRSANAKVEMNDISCFEKLGFICEDDESRVLRALDLSDYRRFLSWASSDLEATTKLLFISVIDLDWTQAKLACENFGMQLYTPETEYDEEMFRSFLNALEEAPETFHVGITSKRSDSWYSVNTGEAFSLQFNATQSEFTDNQKQDCMLLKKTGEVYYYESVPCITHQAHFVCQKIQ